MDSTDPPDRMAESEIFETPSCPEQSDRSLVVQVCLLTAQTMMGLCLLELQRGLQIGFSDHDGDGDTARLVASSDKHSSIGQDNASRRFSHGWALHQARELLILQGWSAAVLAAVGGYSALALQLDRHRHRVPASV